MWPIHGKYTCPDCLRQYSVKWEGPAVRNEYADPALRAKPVAIPSAVTVSN